MGLSQRYRFRGASASPAVTAGASTASARAAARSGRRKDGVGMADGKRVISAGCFVSLWSGRPPAQEADASAPATGIGRRLRRLTAEMPRPG